MKRKELKIGDRVAVYRNLICIGRGVIEEIAQKTGHFYVIQSFDSDTGQFRVCRENLVPLKKKEPFCWITVNYIGKKQVHLKYEDFKEYRSKFSVEIVEAYPLYRGKSVL